MWSVLLLKMNLLCFTLRALRAARACCLIPSGAATGVTLPFFFTLALQSVPKSTTLGSNCYLSKVLINFVERICGARCFSVGAIGGAGTQISTEMRTLSTTATLALAAALVAAAARQLLVEDGRRTRVLGWNRF
jgi:hypothetical protein